MKSKDEQLKNRGFIEDEVLEELKKYQDSIISQTLFMSFVIFKRKDVDFTKSLAYNEIKI